MANPAQYYTTREAEAILGVSAVTLNHWRARGVGPECFKSGREFRYPAKVFKSYVKTLGTDFETLGDKNKRKRIRLANRVEVPDRAAMLEERLGVLETRILGLQRAVLKLRRKP